MLSMKQTDLVRRQNLDLVHVLVRENDQVSIRLQNLERLAGELQVFSVQARSTDSATEDTYVRVAILDHSRSIDEEQETVKEVGEKLVELDGGHIEVRLAVGTHGEIENEAGDEVGGPQRPIKGPFHGSEHCESFQDEKVWRERRKSRYEGGGVGGEVGRW